MTARNARKWLALRGLGSGGSKNRIKKRSRVGPAVVRAEGAKRENVRGEDVKREDVKREGRAEGALGWGLRRRAAAAAVIGGPPF